MEEWKEYKLGDILSVKYGKDHKKIADGSIPIYGSGGIMRFGDRYIFEGPSILIPRKGSLNNIIFADKPFWTVDTMFWTIINQNIANPLFVYYSICKKDFASLNVGSAVPSMTVPVIEDVNIILPPKIIQDKIVSILKSLDDKIECNKRINDNLPWTLWMAHVVLLLSKLKNDNLEQQAKALFKSWFVDFEPFKDGEFVESELGMIPKGWKIVRFDFFIKASSEKVGVGVLPEYSVTNNGIIPRDSKFNKQLSKTTSKNKVLRKNDLVFGMSREILNWGIMEDEIGGVSSAYNVYIINQNVVPSTYLRLFISAKINYFNDLIGTAAREGQSLDKGALMKKVVYVPPTDVYYNYLNIHNSLVKQKDEVYKESCLLTMLRDNLLPKLMSGELKTSKLTM